MRILFLITGLGYGGAETQLVQMADRLRNAGKEVHVVSMLPLAGYAADLAEMNIPVYTLDMRRGAFDPSAVLRLARLIRKLKPDVLHCLMIHANLLGRITRLLARVSVVISTATSITEESDVASGSLQKRELAYKLTDRLCDLTTNVSQACVDRYIEVGVAPKERIRSVPCGVDIDKFSRKPAEAVSELKARLDLTGRFVWLAVGRLTEAKDYPNLLNAFAKVRERYPNALLVIRGQGEQESEVKRLISELKLQDAVRLLLERCEIPELMSTANAYVLSSWFEGMPGALLEASSIGLPAVATDVGGNREVVLHGVSGFIVPPSDPKALADAMCDMMMMPAETREQMGSAGRAHVETNFSFERVIQTWESIYEELLSAKSRR